MMYKAALLLILLFQALFTSGQFTDGALWLGGSFSYGDAINRLKNNNDIESKSKGVTISPFIGKSFGESSIAGVTLHYRNSRDTYAGTSFPKRIYESDYGGGIFFRKYKTLGKGFFLLGSAGLNYSRKNYERIALNDPSDFETIKTNHVGFMVYPEVAYAINKKLHLEMRLANLLSISFLDEKKHSEWPVNNERDEQHRHFNISSDVNQAFSGISFGFRFLINNKRVTKTAENSVN